MSNKKKLDLNKATISLLQKRDAEGVMAGGNPPVPLLLPSAGRRQ